MKYFPIHCLKQELFAIKTQCAMQLKNITEDAKYDSIKHKVYPPNLKVLEQKPRMKKHITKLVKVQGILLNGSFWTSADWSDGLSDLRGLLTKDLFL